MKEKEIENEKIRLMTVSLGIFMLVIPMDTVQLFGRISILRIFAIIPIFLSLFQAKEFKINKSIGYLAIFVLYIFIQIFYTIDTSVTISKFTTFFMYFILLFFCTSIEYNAREIRFLNRMFAASTILAVGLVIFFGIYEHGRLTILINPNKREDENQFCGYFLVGTVYFIKNILEKRKILISFALLTLFLFIALLTGSRGGFIAIVISIATYLQFYAKNDKKKIKKFFIVLVVGIFLIIFTSYLLKLVSPEIAQRFSIENIQEDGGSGRTAIWKYYLNLFKESSTMRQLFGYGTGTATILHGVAHNNWIELLIESGLVGILIYITFIISFLTSAYRKNNIYLFSVLIGYIGLTMSLSLFSYKPIWGVMILIILKNEKDRINDYKKENIRKN